MAAIFPKAQLSSPSNTPCFACGKSDDTLKKCKRCWYAFYCSKKCQIKDWKHHKPVCKYLKNSMEGWAELNQNQTPRVAWKTFNLTNPFHFLSKPPFDQKVERGKTALDLGCGRGGSTKVLLDRGWKVTAIDCFQEPLDKLRKEIAASNPESLESGQLTLLAGDVLTCNFPVVDLIVARDLMPYLPPNKLGVFLQKVERSLNPNGWFLGSLFDQNSRCQWSYGAWVVTDEKMCKALVEKVFDVESCGYRPKKTATATIDFLARKRESENKSLEVDNKKLDAQVDEARANNSLLETVHEELNNVE